MAELERNINNILLQKLKEEHESKNIQQLRLIMCILETPVTTKDWYSPIFDSQYILSIKEQFTFEDLAQHKKQIQDTSKEFHLKIEAFFGKLTKNGISQRNLDSGIVVRSLVLQSEHINLAQFKLKLAKTLGYRFKVVTKAHLEESKDTKGFSIDINNYIETQSQNFSFAKVTNAADLHCLLKSSNPSLNEIKKLISQETNFDIPYKGYPLIHIAMINTRNDSQVSWNVFNSLLELNNINLSAYDVHGKSIIHYAVEREFPNLLIRLVNKLNLDIDIKDAKGNTPLDWSTKYHINSKSYHFLIKHSQAPLSDRLMAAIKAQDIQKVQELFESNKIKIIETLMYKDGNTILNVACGTGNLKLVQLLIKQGCNISLVDIDGNTPLHAALEYDHLTEHLKGSSKLIKYLINLCNIDVNKLNNSNETALDLLNINNEYQEMRSKLPYKN